MNNMRLLTSIGGIDDDLIVRASDTPTEKRI